METLRADEDALARVSAALDAGEVAILPGDLRELLVADALDDDAVARVFERASRPADDPLVVLLSDVSDLHHVAYGGPNVRALAEAHWPGPTIVLLRPRPWVPDAILAGRAEVRVSVPAQPFLRELARHFGPLAACAAPPGASASMRVDAGALPGGEAKVIPSGHDRAP